MALDRAKRDALVQQYADGPTRLRAALATLADTARLVESDRAVAVG